MILREGENKTKMREMNILFIFADQMHAFAMGCMGNPDVKTPNLDRMASEGLLFTNTYSCFPVCTPYRGVLFTGRYGSQTGVRRNNHPLPADGTTLAQDLNDGGYRTSYVGKWHLGTTGNIAVAPELRGGFQEFTGYQCYNDYLRDVWFFDEQGNKTEYFQHRTDVTTDITIEKLKHLQDSKFALFVSYQNPHYPVQPSKRYADMYKNTSVTRRLNAESIDPYTQTFSPPTPNHEMDMNYLRYGSDLDEYLKLYYGMITQLDDNIGRIMNTLQELGLADSTVVIFTADHGDMQGSHGLKNKNVFWEESSHVPLIVKVPGGRQGAIMNELISTVDFYPTILEYASIATPRDKEGTSFAPMTFGENQKWKNVVFSEDARWNMCRYGSHKLVIDSSTLEPTHLFNIPDDPFEMNNLITEQIPEKEMLLHMLLDWRKRMEVAQVGK
jgi:arylsulfatase A-like enzyme